MSRLSSLYTVPRTEHEKAKDVLIDAFTGDPIWEGLSGFSDDAERFSDLFAQMALLFSSRYGEIYASSENMEGVMLINRSQNSYMTFGRILWSGAARPLFKMERASRGVLVTDFESLDQARKKHMKNEFLYIQAIGVAKQWQGKGHGGKMLRAIIEESEQESIPIYLETETPENVELYRKFGFRVVETLMLDKLAIPIWCMVRQVKESQ